MLLYWVWLSQLRKLNPLQKQQILCHFRDPEDAYLSSTDRMDIPKAMQDAMADKDLTRARQIMADCRAQRIGLITMEDDGYPAMLRNVADAPLVLYYKGKLPDWKKQPVIGIVGTRHTSPYGDNMASLFGQQIAACGALVISGGAAGVDTAAMKGAIAVGKPAVAVLGCGLDVVYPAENKALFLKTQEEGCLISEYPPGTRGARWQFPARNRIISGISNAVLVVEAPQISGALNTARHAMEQGRQVYAVPGNIDVPNCAGSNALLQDGAIPVLSGWDVVKEYASQWPGVENRQPELKVAQVPKSVPRSAPSDKKAIDKDEKSTYSVLNSEDLALSDAERGILELIGQSPVPMDELIAQLDMSASTVKTVLTKLSVKGLLVMHPGGRVSLK